MQVTIKQKHVAEHRLPTKPAQDTYRSYMVAKCSPQGLTRSKRGYRYNHRDRAKLIGCKSPQVIALHAKIKINYKTGLGERV